MAARTRSQTAGADRFKSRSAEPARKILYTAFGAALSEIIFQWPVLHWLAASALQPSHILGVLHSLQQLLVILYRQDDRNRFAFSGDNFGFSERRFHESHSITAKADRK